MIMRDSCKCLFLSFLFALALVSCRNEEVDGQDQEASYAPTVSSTAFTATVSGTISGVTYDELNSGQRGILYTDDPEGAQSFFDSWLKGNNNPGCPQVGRIKVNADGVMEAIITKLKPETTYSYCLYYVSRDGGTRLQSMSGSFTTKAFDCTLETAEAQSVGFYKALVPGRARTDANDLSLCKTGIAISHDKDEPLLEDGFVEASSTDDAGTFEINLHELKCGTDYRYRTYLQVEHTGQMLYGPVRTLTTRHPDEQAVDLGLSVKWASCNLGAEEPQEWGGYYKWGETQSSTNADRSRYSLWNQYQSKYIDVGRSICATEYDAAHEAMSGHWRMPTKAEIDELIGSCEMTLHTMGDGYVAEFTANGASISLPAAGLYNSFGVGWAFEKEKEQSSCRIVIQSGERSQNGQRWCWYAEVNPNTNEVVVSATSSSGTITGDGGGVITVGGSKEQMDIMEFSAEFAIPIRPVWDPDLAD